MFVSPRRCRFCDRLFLPHPRAPHQLHCSSQCKRASDNARRRLDKRAICPLCGEMVLVTGNRKYHPECTKQARKLYRSTVTPSRSGERGSTR